jgi:type I restriction enzyme M protein
MTAAADAASVVRRLWQFCAILRDDGLSYPDYVEQLTYLLFLKMSHERDGITIPREYDWSSFQNLSVHDTRRHYEEILAGLALRSPMLRLIFGNAKNKIKDPHKLRRLIDLIGETYWGDASADVKGDAYEGLLEKNARDTKSGAGQYFTPRALIDAIVECSLPKPGEVICDPACGTGGFLLSAHRTLRGLVNTQHAKKLLATSSLRGVELVEEVARLAAMNLLLHGVTGTGNDLPIVCGDGLSYRPITGFDVILSNPPFGAKASARYGVAQSDRRKTRRDDDFVVTSNKQLGFLQHIVSLLKPGGRAAVVVPDNVLFEVGAAAAIRRSLLLKCNLHTVLRLPPGIFYATGVKANVLFFDRFRRGGGEPLPRISYYDLRVGQRYSLKGRPLQRSDLDEFVALYRQRPPESFGRWYSVRRSEVLEDPTCQLDISNAARDVPQAKDVGLNALADAVTADLERALAHIRAFRNRAE